MSMGSMPMRRGGGSAQDDAVSSVLDLISGGGSAANGAGDGIADFLSGGLGDLNDWRERNRDGLLRYAMGSGQGLQGMIGDAAGAVLHQRDQNETEEMRRRALQHLGLGHLMAGPESAPQRPVGPAGQAPGPGQPSVENVAGAGGGGGVLDALNKQPAAAVLSPQGLRRRLAQRGTPRAAY